MYRTYDALEVLCAEVLKLKQVPDELASCLSNHNAVRLRNALQARGKVGRLANDGLFLRSAGADQVTHDHQPRSDAYARL